MIPDMFDKANEGRLKAMYILGENPVLTDPNSNHIRSGLEKLEFLVVHELFMTETAEYADVVLPAASFVECDGTFTNTERRVQLVRQAVKPLPGKANWETIAQMSTRMGYPMNYRHAGEIWAEMASLAPPYSGINFERLEKKGLQWPCPTLDHPGTPFLHAESFTRGKGLFQGIEDVPPAELPDADYPFLLNTGRVLQHYNVTTMYSEGIMSLWNEEYAMGQPGGRSRVGSSSRGQDQGGFPPRGTGDQDPGHRPGTKRDDLDVLPLRRDPHQRRDQRRGGQHHQDRRVQGLRRQNRETGVLKLPLNTGFLKRNCTLSGGAVLFYEADHFCPANKNLVYSRPTLFVI